MKHIKLYEEFTSELNEAVNASGYIKAGKLGYNDQFLGRQSLSKTLSLDLGLNPKDEFSGPWIGFDHVSMYVSGKNGGTVLDDALTGKYTYDELKDAAAKHLGVKESFVNESSNFAKIEKEAKKWWPKRLKGKDSWNANDMDMFIDYLMDKGLVSWDDEDLEGTRSRLEYYVDGTLGYNFEG